MVKSFHKLRSERGGTTLRREEILERRTEERRGFKRFEQRGFEEEEENGDGDRTSTATARRRQQCDGRSETTRTAAVGTVSIWFFRKPDLKPSLLVFFFSKDPLKFLRGASEVSFDGDGIAAVRR
ncbi:hypothetical protein NE237_019075 [Protea cynaroides]|uniref:Uncharacterized protein n=1 Tax=Protea cynaroides TaxID=273540 RepID=A0A9Q0KB36_9MAGN|nr:hypothetical protein NE237_019075 [Protea cynaroides]